MVTAPVTAPRYPQARAARLADLFGFRVGDGPPGTPPRRRRQRRRGRRRGGLLAGRTGGGQRLGVAPPDPKLLRRPVLPPARRGGQAGSGAPRPAPVPVRAAGPAAPSPRVPAARRRGPGSLPRRVAAGASPARLRHHGRRRLPALRRAVSRPRRPSPRALPAPDPGRRAAGG